LPLPPPPYTLTKYEVENAERVHQEFVEPVDVNLTLLELSSKMPVYCTPLVSFK